MGSIFSAFTGGKPKKAAPAPAPRPVQQAIKEDTGKAEKEAEDRRRKIALSARGTRGAMATGSQGVQGQANVLKPTLGG